MSNSEEEEIARDYICFGNPDCTVIVVDATCLERNLNLVFQIMEITDNIVVCVNLLDEAKKKKIHIDLDKLSTELGVPVVGTIARKKTSLNSLMDTIRQVCTHKLEPSPKRIIYNEKIEESLSKIKDCLCNEFSIPSNLSRWLSLKLIDGEEKILESIEKNLNIDLLKNETIQNIKSSVCSELEESDITKNNFKDLIVTDIMHKSEDICGKVCTFEDENYSNRDRKIDKILTSKKFGFPIMLLFLGIIFWLTIVGSNYPSQILFNIFSWFQEKLILAAEFLHCPEWLSSMLINGVYQTLTWIIAVMLPPMAIFFPLFTILEDLGYLPRIAFNMDGFFKKCCCTGKQMITMCMGFGCNAAGVVGCRIIDSPREKLIAILTNNFVPCNRKISFFNSNCNHICCWGNAWFWSFYYFYSYCYICYFIRNLFYISYF